MDTRKEQFLLQDDPKLEATSKVSVATTRPFHDEPLLQLTCGRRSCLATINCINPGPELILIDKHLRLHLRAKLGSPVEVQPARAEEATSLTVRVPAKWISGDAQQRTRRALDTRPFVVGQKLVVRTFQTSDTMVIAKIEPPSANCVGTKTQLKCELLQDREQGAANVTYSDIGGLGPSLRYIRELIEFPLLFSEAMSHLGIESPRGILLTGPPGTGKTLIAKAIANEVGAEFIKVRGPEIVSSFIGKTEETLRGLFTEAAKKAPCIILVDEIDSIAPKRSRTVGEMEQRMVATLLTLMDGLHDAKGIMVIGTTNRPNAIDEALRRPGRFEEEIFIGIPDTQGRREILEIHTRLMPLADDVNLQDLAERTHGFTGADIASLCRKAGYTIIRKKIDVSKIKGATDVDLADLEVGQDDFNDALSLITPSALREVVVQTPKNLSFDRIGGLAYVKMLIRENVIQYIKNPELFAAMGVRPTRGILLYGPPGTGKTLIAKAIACECKLNFIPVRGPELRSKWYGESEEKLRTIFETARRAAPCILFFDEIDSLLPVRGGEGSGLSDSIVNQFLAETDGVVTSDQVFMIGATNRLELLDEAALRPGRFDYKIEIPLPDEAGRAEIFRIHLKPTIMDADVEYGVLVEESKGLSGADIAEVCRIAALHALRQTEFRTINKVGMELLQKALAEVKLYKQQRRQRSIGFDQTADERTP